MAWVEKVSSVALVLRQRVEEQLGKHQLDKTLDWFILKNLPESILVKALSQSFSEVTLGKVTLVQRQCVEKQLGKRQLDKKFDCKPCRFLDTLWEYRPWGLDKVRLG